MSQAEEYLNILEGALGREMAIRGIHLLYGSPSSHLSVKGKDPDGWEANYCLPNLKFKHSLNAGNAQSLYFRKDYAKGKIDMIAEFETVPSLDVKTVVPLDLSEFKATLLAGRESPLRRSASVSNCRREGDRQHISLSILLTLEEFRFIKDKLTNGQVSFEWSGKVKWHDISNPEALKRLREKNGNVEPSSLQLSNTIVVSTIKEDDPNAYGAVRGLLNWEMETIVGKDDNYVVWFKDTMEQIGEPVIPSDIAEDVDKALEIADTIGYPVIIRPAFTLGGTGGGVAYNNEEMRQAARTGLDASPITQILVEKYIAGWKEIEFETMRDAAGNCIAVCSMENVDPVGLEKALPVQLHRQRQARLAAQPRQHAVGLFLFDDVLHGLDRQRLQVDLVRQRLVGHDRGGVRVHQHHVYAGLLQHPAGLGPGVVKLRRLPDDDGAGADHQNLFDGFIQRHIITSFRRNREQGHRATGKQSSGLFSARWGRQALGNREQE